MTIWRKRNAETKRFAVSIIATDLLILFNSESEFPLFPRQPRGLAYPSDSQSDQLIAIDRMEIKRVLARRSKAAKNGMKFICSPNSQIPRLLCLPECLRGPRSQPVSKFPIWTWVAAAVDEQMTDLSDRLGDSKSDTILR